jgi:hypothetical protein
MARMDEERARGLCRNTCKHATCTGRGDTGRWAHRCQLVPVPDGLATVHTSRVIPPPIRDSPGLVPHDYGPHDPATAPTTVTVLGKGTWPQPEARPLPASLVRQRATINGIAHDGG